jgi:L-gulonate 3-dehydrogenase
VSDRRGHGDNGRVIALVGCGAIGIGWAVVFARAGYRVRIHDADPDRLAYAPGEVRTILQDLRRHRLLPESAAVTGARIETADAMQLAVNDASYVQESGPELADVKRALLAAIDKAAPSDAVIASSSSAIPISTVADTLPGRARCLVVHPANPPYLLPVVEIVPAAFTAPTSVTTTRELLRSTGMSPVVVHHEPEGFALNRLQGALLREAYCLVRDGVVGVDEVDRLVRDGLGRRWAFCGPFETADLNTPGGVERHAERMGPAYQRMGAERGQHDPWTPQLVSEVTRQRRASQPLGGLRERVAWRNRALMELEQLRRRVDHATGETAVAHPTDHTAEP